LKSTLTIKLKKILRFYKTYIFIHITNQVTMKTLHNILTILSTSFTMQVALWSNVCSYIIGGDFRYNEIQPKSYLGDVILE
jgi:hypothetical protein